MTTATLIKENISLDWLTFQRIGSLLSGQEAQWFAGRHGDVEVVESFTFICSQQKETACHIETSLNWEDSKVYCNNAKQSHTS